MHSRRERWRLAEVGARPQVLLLHHDGRHGLDLPFVTHIFLLRTIWEAGYEKQVVSRARRIGATGPVVVDQLLCRGTAEDALFDLRGRSEDDRVDGLLRGLRLLRPDGAASPAARPPAKKRRRRR